MYKKFYKVVFPYCFYFQGKIILSFKNSKPNYKVCLGVMRHISLFNESIANTFNSNNSSSNNF